MSVGDGVLNEHQRRHLLATCQYIDRQLADLEALLAADASAGTLFARYQDDLSAPQKAALRESCTRIRVAMTRVLEAQGITTATVPASSRHVARSSLGFMDIALEELKPGHMRHYGEVAAGAAGALEELVRDLQQIVQAADAALSAMGEAPRAATASAPPMPAVSSEQRSAIAAEFTRTWGMTDDARAVIDKLRGPIESVVFEALEHAADRASRGMDAGDRDAASVNRAIATGISEVATERAEDVRRALANVIAKARDTCRLASAAAGEPESRAVDRAARLLRQVPAFTFDPGTVDLQLPLRRLLGATVAHQRARRAIEARVGGPLADALSAHAAALHDWALAVWTTLREDLDCDRARWTAQ